MLIFDHVSFTYSGQPETLNDLSFHITEGEQVGLIGANGAGKSTLMKTALGLLQAEGRITVDGIEVTRSNLSEVRRRMGYVLQDSDQQMFMPTVMEDMMFGPVNYGMSREEAAQTARQVLQQLNAEYLADRHNHRISGGEKKIAAIATILAMEPKIMLMDEPSSSLDPRNRRNLIHVLNSLPVTKVMATHDLDMVLETCDRVILISHGQIAADGPAQEILQNRELLEANGLELPFCMAGIPKRGN